MSKPDKNFIITIDGPSGAGKSTVSKKIAARLNLSYIDTGAMYRCVAWAARETGLDVTNESALAPLLQNLKIRFQAAGKKNPVFCNDHEVTDLIRSPEIDRLASAVSGLACVRNALLPLQRAAAQNSRAIIDGRDAGTVIFPHADLKIYLDADLSTRAKRRLEDQKQNAQVDLKSVTEAIARRDRADSSRTQAPLCKAEDAILIDSTDLDIEGVSQRIIDLYKARING
ncbi:MAG: (d)CMP kinase [Deltaproteobacteria bacterium]|nr:(d)CMP kinase [Deltaproteobacteria bacterium]